MPSSVFGVLLAAVVFSTLLTSTNAINDTNDNSRCTQSPHKVHMAYLVNRDSKVVINIDGRTEFDAPKLSTPRLHPIDSNNFVLLGVENAGSTKQLFAYIYNIPYALRLDGGYSRVQMEGTSLSVDMSALNLKRSFAVPSKIGNEKDVLPYGIVLTSRGGNIRFKAGSQADLSKTPPLFYTVKTEIQAASAVSVLCFTNVTEKEQCYADFATWAVPKKYTPPAGLTSVTIMGKMYSYLYLDNGRDFTKRNLFDDCEKVKCTYIDKGLIDAIPVIPPWPDKLKSTPLWMWYLYIQAKFGSVCPTSRLDVLNTMNLEIIYDSSTSVNCPAVNLVLKVAFFIVACVGGFLTALFIAMLSCLCLVEKSKQRKHRKKPGETTTATTMGTTAGGNTTGVNTTEYKTVASTLGR